MEIKPTKAGIIEVAAKIKRATGVDPSLQLDDHGNFVCFAWPGPGMVTIWASGKATVTSLGVEEDLDPDTVAGLAPSYVQSVNATVAVTSMSERLGSALITIAKSQGSDDEEVGWYVGALENDARQVAESPMGDLGRVMILTEREGGDGLLERVVEMVVHGPASADRLGTSTHQQVTDLRAEVAAAEGTSEQRRVYIDALHKQLAAAKSRLEEEYNRGRSVLWAEIVGAVTTAIGIGMTDILVAGPTKGVSMLVEEVGKAVTDLLATVPGAYDDEDEATLVDVVAHVVAAHESRQLAQATTPTVKVSGGTHIGALGLSAAPTSGNKYHRTVYDITPGSPGSVTIDVYSVLIAFDVRDPGLQHAAKKILCAGIRGKASRSQDLREARDALDRAIQEAERAEKGGV